MQELNNVKCTIIESKRPGKDYIKLTQTTTFQYWTDWHLWKPYQSSQYQKETKTMHRTRWG